MPTLFMIVVHATVLGLAPIAPGAPCLATLGELRARNLSIEEAWLGGSGVTVRMAAAGGQRMALVHCALPPER
jgi:hypothetical protein